MFLLFVNEVFLDFGHISVALNDVILLAVSNVLKNILIGRLNVLAQGKPSVC